MRQVQREALLTAGCALTLSSGQDYNRRRLASRTRRIFCVSDEEEETMKDRTPLMLATIAVLTVLAVYANWDLVNQGFKYSSQVTNLLSWQSEDKGQRSLRLRQGLDLQGGLQVLLQADQSGLVQLGPGDLDAAANVIKNRVDALGVTEPLVQTQGDDKIVVELPGVDDPDLAVRTIGQTAKLEFIYAADRNLFEGDAVSSTDPVLFDELPEDKQKPFLGNPADPLGQGLERGDAAAAEDEAAAVDASAAITDTSAAAGASDAITSTDSAADATGAITDTSAANDAAAGTADDATADDAEAPADAQDTIYPTVITGESVKDSGVAYDQLGQPVVTFLLDSDGGERMQRFTRSHIDEIMAITLDDKVISAPAVRASIATEGQISGNFTQPEAESLSIQIKSGSLPVPLKVLGQTRIGPTLGGETITAAIRGGIVGLISVLLFMLFYYRMPGLVANVALVLYALFTLTIFRLFPVTLTLAGIAGFVLSIGMAVDANILIFERMKEELRAGRRIGQAMDIGFSRAWPSIRDSNVSTLITCAILFWFGNQFGASIVKGFAVTLALGVMTSLFTAITVTRTFLKVANRIVLRDADVTPMEDPRLKALFGF
jgi:preprotein translocase subunit SecD